MDTRWTKLNFWSWAAPGPPTPTPIRRLSSGTAVPHASDLFYAANTFYIRHNRPAPKSLSEEKLLNETAACKIIGITLEVVLDSKPRPGLTPSTSMKFGASGHMAALAYSLASSTRTIES